MGSEGIFCPYICPWLIFALLFAVYLRFGLESAMIHHEGTLVSASRTSCSGSATCKYYVNERFLYDNNTHHCTVTRPHGYYKKSIANHAVSKVELGTTRTIWLKPGAPHTCFDEEILHANFVTSMVMLAFGWLPCCCVGCALACDHASSLRLRLARPAETSENKHTPVVEADIEMVFK